MPTVSQGAKLIGLLALGSALWLFLTRGARASSSSPAVDRGGAPAPVGTFMDPNSLTSTNSTLAQRRQVFAPYFDQASADYGLPPGLLLAQGTQESSLDPSAVSPKGASAGVGIMQLSHYFPGAGVDALADIQTAAKEMARLYRVFGAWSLALAGYDAGQTAVADAGPAVPAFPETQDYVTRITAAAGINEPWVTWA